MAIWNSYSLCEEEIEDLKARSVFGTAEIEMLFERFSYLDRSRSGFLTFAEFQMIPEFHSNPFSRLILAHLENMNEYEKINFAGFLEFLSMFSAKTPKSRRIGFLFSIFDVNRDGRVDRRALNEVHRVMRGYVDESAAEQVLDMYDRSSKGYLNRQDITRMYNEDESLERNMVIDFARNIQSTEDVSIWDVVWPSNAKKEE